MMNMLVIRLIIRSNNLVIYWIIYNYTLVIRIRGAKLRNHILVWRERERDREERRGEETSILHMTRFHVELYNFKILDEIAFFPLV